MRLCLLGRSFSQFAVKCFLYGISFMLVALWSWPETSGQFPDIPCNAFKLDSTARLFVNPDVIKNISSSSAAFLALWWHFFKPNTSFYANGSGGQVTTCPRKQRPPFCTTSLESHTKYFTNPGPDYANGPLYSLSGKDGICNYRVMRTTECQKHETLCTPLSIDRREALPLLRETSTDYTPLRSVVDFNIGWSNVQHKCSGRRHGRVLPSTTVVMGLWNTQITTLTEWKTPQQYLRQIALAFELFLDQGIVVFADAAYLEGVQSVLAELEEKWTTEGHIEKVTRLFERVCVVRLEFSSLPYYHLRSHVRVAASAALRDPRYHIDLWNPPYFVHDYHIVQMSKMALTYATAMANPFNSKFIMWIDPPRPSWYTLGPQGIRRFLDGDFLSEHTKPGAILMQRGPERTSPGPWARPCHGGIRASQTKYHPGVIGTLFGATPDAWAKVFPVWEAVGFSLLSLALLNDEQHQHTVAACWFPQYFHIVPYHSSCHPHFVCLPKIISDANATERHINTIHTSPGIDWSGYSYPLDISRGIPEELVAASA